MYMLKRIVFYFFVIRMYPIYIVYIVKKYLLKDNEIEKYRYDTAYFGLGFFRLLYERPEYISVLYMRLGGY